MQLNLRLWVVAGTLILATVGLIWRMVDLMIVNRTFLQGQGNARSLRVVSIPAYRGMITDRNGQPLAVSTPVDAVWVDPKEFSPTPQQLTVLAKLLELSPKKISQQLARSHAKEFVYLKRELNPFHAEKIKALDIPGLYFLREFRRYYPEGEVTAQVVGFTNIDDQGQEGCELSYNDWLRGIAGKKRIIKDRLGHVVADVNLIRAPQPGRSISLSIDRRIQYIAYRELKEAIQKNAAESGSIIVLDTVKGEILAMANQPSFNPNNRPSKSDPSFRNRAVTDVFEPGSTLKSFSVAYALLKGKYTPTTLIETAPGWMTVDGKTVKDIHNYGLLTVTGVLQHSSNVGVTKMLLDLPPDPFWQILYNVGFGRLTDSGFPGESPGSLVKPTQWRPFRLATLGFGYGLNATNLQLVQAYSVFANHGIKRPISLIRLQQSPAGERVLSKDVADKIVAMLETVVGEGGSAVRAQIPGYRISGKTGTVRIVGPNGYEAHHHIGIFVGMASVTRPRLIVAVVIKDPQRGKYYGGDIAAPVFAKVMGSALRILDVPPDKMVEPHVT